MPQSSSFRVRASHPLRTHFPEGSATLMTRRGAGPTTPGAAAMHRPGLGSCAFARHYLRNHCYFLFLRVLRCFSSPGSPTGDAPVWRDRSRRVSPFGHPRVAGHLPLTAAFRSLSRPSSPPRATGIPHAPFFSFLSLFKRHAVRMSPGRGPRRGRAFSTLVVVARFLFQLDFSLRFRDSPAASGAGRLALYSSRSQHVNDLISSCGG